MFLTNFLHYKKANIANFVLSVPFKINKTTNFNNVDHPAGTSKNCDKCDTIKSFWHVITMVVNEKISFSSVSKN